MTTTTTVGAQLAPGTVRITEDPAELMSYGMTPRAGWALVVIGRASKPKKFSVTPAEEIALYEALLKRPAVKAKLSAAKPKGGGRAAPIAPVTSPAADAKSA